MFMKAQQTKIYFIDPGYYDSPWVSCWQLLKLYK